MLYKCLCVCILYILAIYKKNSYITVRVNTQELELYLIVYISFIITLDVVCCNEEAGCALMGGLLPNNKP